MNVKHIKIRMLALAMLCLIAVLALTGPAAASDSDPAIALPEGVSQDWWTTVQKTIRESEYHVTWQDQTALADLPAAYQASNRAQHFRTYFTTDGIRVVPRTHAEEQPAWVWGLEFIGYGAATMTTNGNRVEYQRGDLTEWYVNDAKGLEQGFTLARIAGFQPADEASRDAGDPDVLILDLAVCGTAGGDG